MIRATLLFVTLAAAPGWTQSVSPAEALASGRAALTAGDVNTAVTVFEQVVAQAPAWELGHLQLGVALRLQGNGGVEQARVHLSRAVQLAPNNARAQHELGLVCEDLGDTPAAIAAFGRALELRPDLVDARFRLATLVRASDETRAVQLYGEVLAAEPQHLGALTALAQIYEFRGELVQAESALHTIVQVQSANAYPLYELARFYERQGEGRKARDAYARAARVDPKPPRRMRALK